MMKLGFYMSSFSFSHPIPYSLSHLCLPLPLFYSLYTNLNLFSQPDGIRIFTGSIFYVSAWFSCFTMTEDLDEMRQLTLRLLWFTKIWHSADAAPVPGSCVSIISPAPGSLWLCFNRAVYGSCSCHYFPCEMYYAAHAYACGWFLGGYTWAGKLEIPRRISAGYPPEGGRISSGFWPMSNELTEAKILPNNKDCLHFFLNYYNYYYYFYYYY